MNEYDAWLGAVEVGDTVPTLAEYRHWHRQDPEVGHRLEKDHLITLLEQAVARLEAVETLATEASMKGRGLHLQPELRLAGNAYLGMSERIRRAVEGHE